jgi:hypothetical protein
MCARPKTEALSVQGKGTKERIAVILPPTYHPQHERDRTEVLEAITRILSPDELAHIRSPSR